MLKKSFGSRHAPTLGHRLALPIPRRPLIAQDDVDHWTLQTRPKPGDD